MQTFQRCTGSHLSFSTVEKRKSSGSCQVIAPTNPLGYAHVLCYRHKHCKCSLQMHLTV